MNRRIKYLLFFVGFITVNLLFSLTVLFVIAGSLDVLADFYQLSMDRRLLFMAVSLVLSFLISLLGFFKMYCYAERKWYLEILFGFKSRERTVSEYL